MSSIKHIRFAVSLTLLIVLCVGSLFMFGVKGLRFFEVPSSSMQPTLQRGDRFTSVRAGQYYRGDIVVLKDPANPGAYMVKRVVAVGGDTVEVKGGRLWLNGVQTQETYLSASMDYVMPPLAIPAGQVFIMGDDRNASVDGSTWKSGVSLDDIIGKAVYIYSPGDRRGSIVDGRAAFAGVR